MNVREQRFRKVVHRWWKQNRRDLPWRRTHDPYRILVSEIMLQQTQVDRVIPKYREFLRRFPTVRKLAAAPRADVLRAWSGLGYNRRAVALHRAAHQIIQNYGGRTAIVFPQTFNELMKLPGVGEYTARAILTFAHDAPYAPVDTNIRRIFIRHFGKRTEHDLQTFADHILAGAAGPSTRLRVTPSEWSQMLMDFGALVCTSRNPQCVTLGLRHIAEPETRRSAQPFKDSNRYWRGRIVDVLRQEQRPLTLGQLTVNLRKLSPVQIARKRTHTLLTDLEHDGILIRTRDSRILLA